MTDCDPPAEAPATSASDRPYLFRAASPPEADPPLLLLHGDGGDEYSLLELRESLSPGAAVLSVRGTVTENGRNRFFRRAGEDRFDEADLRERADELADFVRAAGAVHGIAPGALVAVGFSNGANMTSAMLLRRPGVVRAAVLFSGMTPFAEPPAADLTGTLVVVSTGARDTVAWQQTPRLVAQLRDRGADVVEVHHPGGHAIDDSRLPVIRDLLRRR